jgi:hypothetical protein
MYVLKLVFTQTTNLHPSPTQGPTIKHKKKKQIPSDHHILQSPTHASLLQQDQRLEIQIWMVIIQGMQH